jgi:DNA mismatch repair protein MutL
MSRIHLLPPHLANQIAAGEVVERPAATLKELLENALDANATEIHCRWSQGGSTLIEVSDNGSGIEPEDLHLALSRHATSKINSTEDLFKIGTWGFRGEALASIAAVSNLTIRSRTKQQPIATELQCQGGQLEGQRSVARGFGTTVTVRDLFFNTPARKEFLKSQSAETSYGIQVFHRIALSSPSIDLILTIDDELRFHYKACNQRQRTIDVYRQAWKIELPEKNLVEVETSSGELKLHAYLLPATHHIPSSRGLFFFVNRRSVKDKLLLQAVMAASREVLFGSLYPQGAIFIDLPFDGVDVNVHPSKSEVRFRNPNHVFAFIRKHIEKTLAAQSPRWSGENANHEMGVRNDFGTQIQSTFYDQAPSNSISSAQPSALLNLINNSATQVAGQPPNFTNLMDERALQFLGTLKETYLLCSDKDGILLVDQHAAHERITYEKLKQQDWKRSAAVKLLIPIQLELQRDLLDLIEPQFGVFLEMGLGIERLGPGRLQVTTLPALLMNADGTSTLNLHRFFQSLKVASEDLPSSQWSHYLEKELLAALASQSCHSSVRAGQRLNEVQARSLLNQMTKTDFSGHCPHGRPTSITLSWSEIERMFKRRV